MPTTWHLVDTFQWCVIWNLNILGSEWSEGDLQMMCTEVVGRSPEILHAIYCFTVFWGRKFNELEGMIAFIAKPEIIFV